MKNLGLCATVACLGVIGCISDPMISTIRVRPEIAAADERVLSLQLVTPTAASPERVIYRGVYTAAVLEDSADTLADFRLGYARPDQLRNGNVKLVLQESGKSRVLELRRSEAIAGMLYLDLIVPLELTDVEYEWSDGPSRWLQPAHGEAAQ
jgi:hypothetical protein